MIVLLKSCGNPDYGQHPNKELFGVGKRWVTIASFKEASEVCSKYITDNELGSGNWAGGVIVENGNAIARVSYNGRVWEGGEYHPDAKEITW